MEQDIKKSLWHISNFIQPRYQVVLMIMTMSIVLGLSYYRMLLFRNVDPAPGLNTIEVISDKQGPIQVTTGAYLRNFLTFDMLANEFVADLFLWFEFDPKKVDKKDVEDFSFGKAEVIYKSKAYESIKDDKAFLGYDLKVKFPSNLNFKNFPLDSHRLYLTLNNLSLKSDKTLLRVKPTSFMVADSIFTFGWKSIGHQVKSGFKNIKLENQPDARVLSFPRVVFAFDFLSDSFKRFLLIVLPLLVIFFLGLFSLSIKFEEYYSSVVSIAVAVITALVSYRFVIETISPRVSYFMLSDRIFNLFLILGFFIFLIDCVFITKLERFRGMIVLIFHLVLITWWVGLLFF